MGRLEEAESFLGPFLEQFGVNEVALMEMAQIAEARKDWSEALIRWQRLKSKFPMFQPGYRGVIGVLRQLGKTDEIDRVLLELIDRFPDELGHALDYAENAYALGGKLEVARRWASVLERFSNCETAYRHRADALSALGQEEAAAAIRAEYQARFAT